MMLEETQVNYQNSAVAPEFRPDLSESDKSRVDFSEVIG
jgi:hypothetical protein